MKKIFTLAVILLFSISSFAQKEPKLVLNEETNLIEATYYHDNGIISQTGSFNKEGKLEGEWLSFDEKGEKLVLAYYDNGNKVGKWIHWVDGVKKVVHYDNNVASL